MSNRISKKLEKSNKKAIIMASLISTIVAIGIISYIYIIPTVNNNIRKDRIISIFKSLNLNDQEYLLMREYGKNTTETLDWTLNKNDTYTRLYVRHENVNTTMIEVNKLALDAGWTYIGEPYTIDPVFSFDSATSKGVNTFDYKTTDNEYIRISMSSKLRDDAFFNNPNMSQDELVALDKYINSSPTDIRIQVNLDGVN